MSPNIPTALAVLTLLATQSLAIDTNYGGMGSALDGEYFKLVGNASVFWFAGPLGDRKIDTDKAEDLKWLADHQVRILFRLWWWDSFAPEEQRNTPLDVYYNESYREKIKQAIAKDFQHIDPEKTWAVILSEEEPAAGYYWTIYSDPLQPYLKRYSQQYFEETGFELKPWLNETEKVVFEEWLEEKNAWTFNHLYDYVKNTWPQIEVLQFVFARPSDWGLCEPYELKSDGFVSDHYRGENDPFWRLYSANRLFLTMFPKKPFHQVLWGIGETEGLASSYDDMRLDAWVSYLSGVDGIGWFKETRGGMGPWQSAYYNDKKYQSYTNALNRELLKLPAIKPSPKILLVENAQARGLFTEYDVVSERFLAKTDFDLSRYDLVVSSASFWHDETVDKINSYVENGGNVYFQGGPGDERSYYRNGSRKLFLLEQGAERIGLGGHVLINVSTPNLLDLDFSYENYGFYGVGFRTNQSDAKRRRVGRFYSKNQEVFEELADASLIVAYHDSNYSNKGWMFSWGAQASTGQIEDGDYDYGAMEFMDREVLRAFVKNTLGLKESVATGEQEGLLITKALFDENKILVGIVNDEDSDKNFAYSLAVGSLGFPDDTYNVFSFRENSPVGEYESDGGWLELPVSISGKTIELFLVSPQPISLPYSINISPEPEKVRSANMTLLCTNYSSGEKRVFYINVSNQGDLPAEGVIALSGGPGVFSEFSSTSQTVNVPVGETRLVGFEYNAPSLDHEETRFVSASFYLGTEIIAWEDECLFNITETRGETQQTSVEEEKEEAGENADGNGNGFDASLILLSALTILLIGVVIFAAKNLRTTGRQEF